jgi:predicted RNase H-like HicB family nuclease
LKLSYTILLEPAEEGGYVVRVPRLPGCVTEGDTVEDALANAREAITVYLLSLRDEGRDFPAADGGAVLVHAVEVDVDAA